MTQIQTRRQKEFGRSKKEGKECAEKSEFLLIDNWRQSISAKKTKKAKIEVWNIKQLERVCQSKLNDDYLKKINPDDSEDEFGLKNADEVLVYYVPGGTTRESKIKKICAFAAIMKAKEKNKKYIYLDIICSALGASLGIEMIDKIIEHYGPQGFKWIELDAISKTAQQFYLRNGFQMGSLAFPDQINPDNNKRDVSRYMYLEIKAGQKKKKTTVKSEKAEMKSKRGFQKKSQTVKSISIKLKKNDQ